MRKPKAAPPPKKAKPTTPDPMPFRGFGITLGLAGLAAGLVAACGDPAPRQAIRQYCDPQQPTVCVTERRAGYTPVYWPMFFNGYYYGPGGYITSPPAMGTTDYTIARQRAVSTTFSPTGTPSRTTSAVGGATSTGTGTQRANPVSRGGFGSSASGRAAAS